MKTLCLNADCSETTTGEWPDAQPVHPLLRVGSLAWIDKLAYCPQCAARMKAANVIVSTPEPQGSLFA